MSLHTFISDPGFMCLIIFGLSIIGVLFTWIFGIIHINNICKYEAKKCIREYVYYETRNDLARVTYKNYR